MQERFDFESIDFNELYTMLLSASRDAFRFARQSHPDETFYAFALHYVKAAQFIYPRFGSEEAHLRKHNLTEHEREHQTLRWFYHRWNLSEWPQCDVENKQLRAISGWVSRTWRSARLFPDALIVWGNIKYKLEHICVKVLKTLDEEGLFGDRAAREKIVLIYRVEEDALLWERDEYERVRLLNSDSAYLRWRIEKEMCDHARVFLERDQEDEWEIR